MRLPPLPDRSLLADLCRETAAIERVQPQLVEKDFYLTRLLWALGQHFGDALLLKGGTLLSKVDLGFLRLSEDADLVLPGTPSRRSSQNVGRMRRVSSAIAEISGAVGVTARFPAGELHHQAAHGVWQLEYASEFGPQRIMLEASIRPVLRPPREVPLRQLLADPLAGDVKGATCFALASLEAHAEKVRAAFTRDAIRDFYDLDRLLAAGADLSSPEFLALVDGKLEELHAVPLARQGKSFALDANRRRVLEAGLARDLPAVLRADAPAFDLDVMLARFDVLWRKRGRFIRWTSRPSSPFDSRWRANGGRRAYLHRRSRPARSFPWIRTRREARSRRGRRSAGHARRDPRNAAGDPPRPPGARRGRPTPTLSPRRSRRGPWPSSERCASDLPVLRRWGFAGLVSQAGLALGIANQASSDFPIFGAGFAALAVAVVAVNEVVGPILFKAALERADEAGKAAARGGHLRPRRSERRSCGLRGHFVDEEQRRRHLPAAGEDLGGVARRRAQPSFFTSRGRSR